MKKLFTKKRLATLTRVLEVLAWLEIYFTIDYVGNGSMSIGNGVILWGALLAVAGLCRFVRHRFLVEVTR